MQELIIGGIVRDLRHLKEFISVVPGKGKDGADLRVAVSFGLHAISESCNFGQHDMTDENGKPRQFSEARYAFSLGLPELARRMIDQNYYCWESADRNRAMNYAVVDVAPARVRHLADGEHQVLFFYLYPADGHAADVRLIITSCHSREIIFSRIRRRYNIHSQLRACLYGNRRIP